MSRKAKPRMATATPEVVTMPATGQRKTAAAMMQAVTIQTSAPTRSTRRRGGGWPLRRTTRPCQKSASSSLTATRAPATQTSARSTWPAGAAASSSVGASTGPTCITSSVPSSSATGQARRRSGVGSAIPLPRLPELHGCAGGAHHQHAALLAIASESRSTRPGCQCKHGCAKRSVVPLKTCEGQQSVGTLLTGG